MLYEVITLFHLAGTHLHRLMPPIATSCMSSPRITSYNVCYTKLLRTSNGSNKNSIGVTANANTNTSIISFNQIDGYDLGFKLSNVDDLQIYTNSINQKVYDEYTTLFDQATDKKPIFKGDLMAYGVLVEKGTRITSYNVCYTKLLRHTYLTNWK